MSDEFHLDRLPSQLPLTALGDVIPLELANDRWRQEYDTARTDSLTGIYNRRWLTETLDTLTETEAGNFSLAFIDLDGLKQTNDRHGHEAGNILLVKAADTLQTAVRQQQSEQLAAELVHAAVRLAGDEYVLVLTGVRAQAELDAFTLLVGQRLAAAGIGASIGGRPHRAGETGLELLAAVDTLMYDQKLLRKQQEFNSLPVRRRLAAHLGTRLLRYAGLNPPRSPAK